MPKKKKKMTSITKIKLDNYGMNGLKTISRF